MKCAAWRFPLSSFESFSRLRRPPWGSPPRVPWIIEVPHTRLNPRKESCYAAKGSCCVVGPPGSEARNKKKRWRIFSGGLPLANEEPATIAWFALQLAPSTFGIFDAFPDEAGAMAHLGAELPLRLWPMLPSGWPSRLRSRM